MEELEKYVQKKMMYTMVGILFIIVIILFGEIMFKMNIFQEKQNYLLHK